MIINKYRSKILTILFDVVFVFFTAIMEKNNSINSKKKNSIWSLLKNYNGWLMLMILLSLLSNGLNLAVPKIISSGIDQFTNGTLVMKNIILIFSLVTILIFVFFYLQSLVQTYLSEKVARDLRQKLAEKISQQTYSYVEKVTPAKLLTNLTADIDSIKMFVAQAIVSIVSSVFTIIGASFLLIQIDWQLALVVLMIMPLIGGTFFVVFSRIKNLFLKTRELVDWLNRIINESILGSSLIRVLNSHQAEYNKFLAANSKAKDLGMQILQLFAAMIPIISFVANLAVLAVLALGGHFVITGKMSLGDFTAFYNYINILIFPILIIGFMSNIIAQATASYERVADVLDSEEPKKNGVNTDVLKGKIEFKNVSLNYGNKTVLKNVSFSINPRTKTAIIGPTAAGKTQLLYLLTGLIQPEKGQIEYDEQDISDFELESFHRQLGLVFQDSIIFNLSLRENIAFGGQTDEKTLVKAINTAELQNFIDSLPDKLETIVSERGTSLSGGQKQRIMLARALALNPKILLLDDFTARVDAMTEKNILLNVAKNYPDITLISVTQKISSIEQYDQIILLMEGEVLAQGTHQQLLSSSPEYAQIFKSQQSTSNYELQS